MKYSSRINTAHKQWRILRRQAQLSTMARAALDMAVIGLSLTVLIKTIEWALLGWAL